MNLSPRKNLILALLAASLVGIVLAFALCRPVAPTDEADERPAAKARAKTVKPKRIQRQREVPAVKESDVPVSADERLSDSLQRAALDGDLAEARRLAEKALLSTNADVRESAVSTLGWFGEESLPELTAFLSDGDETVRREAMGQWKIALGSLEDEKQRESIVRMTMKGLRDPEVIAEVAGELPGISERGAIRILNEMIRSGNRALAAQAFETYKFITGKDYTTKEDAAAWLEETEDVD